MFLLREPSGDQVRAFIEGQSPLPFSYREVGATRGLSPEVPRGYVADRYRVRIGEGRAAFERGREALRAWRPFDLGWVELHPRGAPVEVGTTVAVLARHLGFRSLNAARVVYVDREEEHRWGFAYGTLPGHAERGEERFGVFHDRRSGDVYYEVLAFSHPNHPLALAGFPVARLLQRRFARDSKRAMVAAGRSD